MAGRRTLLVAGVVLVAGGVAGAIALAVSGSSTPPACPPAAAHAAGIDVLAEADQAPSTLWATSAFADRVDSGTVPALPAGGPWQLVAASGAAGHVVVTLHQTSSTADVGPGRVGTVTVAVTCTDGHWLLDGQGPFRTGGPPR